MSDEQKQAEQPAEEARTEGDAWHDAVLAQCMVIECAYVADDPVRTVRNLIDWHVQNERSQPAEKARLSWNGYEVIGDPASIKEVYRLIGCAGRLTELETLLAVPAEEARGVSSVGLLKAFDAAYFKAEESSRPDDWLEAALLGRQWRNSVLAARAAAKPFGYINADDVEAMRDPEFGSATGVCITAEAWDESDVPVYLAAPGAAIEDGKRLLREQMQRTMDVQEECARLRAAAPAAAEAIHYPQCWDTAAYPTVESALAAVYEHYRCTQCAAHSRQPEGAALTDEEIVAAARGAGLSEFIGYDRAELGKELRLFARAILARASESRAEGLTFADGIDSAAEVIDRLAEQYAASKNEPAGRILEDLALSVRALAAQKGDA